MSVTARPLDSNSKGITLSKRDQKDSEVDSTVMTPMHGAWPLRTVRIAGCDYIDATVRKSMCHQKGTQDEPIHKGKITACSPQQATDSTVQDQSTLKSTSMTNDGCDTKTRRVAASLGAQMIEPQCSVAPAEGMHRCIMLHQLSHSEISSASTFRQAACCGDHGHM